VRLMGRLSMTTATPVLILHGGSDKILAPFGSRVLYHRIMSPDKNLMILPGANHTLFWNQSSAAVWAAVVWMKVEIFPDASYIGCVVSE